MGSIEKIIEKLKQFIAYYSLVEWNSAGNVHMGSMDYE